MDEWFLQLLPVEIFSVISSWRWLKSGIVLRVNLDILQCVDLYIFEIIVTISVNMDEWLSQLFPVHFSGIISSWGWLKTSVMLWVNLDVFEIIM